MKRNFGRASGVGLSEGDFNVDGKVDYGDLQMLMGNFGSTGSAPANTPEPATALLFSALGLPALMNRRKK